MYKPAVDPPAAEEEFQVLRHAKDEMKKLKDELHEYKDKEKQVVTDDVVRFFLSVVCIVIFVVRLD